MPANILGQIAVWGVISIAGPVCNWLPLSVMQMQGGPMMHCVIDMMKIARRIVPRLAVLAVLVAMHGCGPAREDSAERREARKGPGGTAESSPSESRPAPFVPKPIAVSGTGAVDFDIRWPPTALAPVRRPPRRSLLCGQLHLRGDTSEKTDPKIVIRLVLTRPHDTDADREFWNSQTLFKQYESWMPYVRGEDAEGKIWLWPNLAYLFKLHGTDRVERYGGWDRGHSADNDFGGVLIRKYDASGDTESGQPLVSADWHSVGADKAGLFDVAHTAGSDHFTLHPEDNARPCSGLARVWFIYGDFMTWRAPWKYAAGPMKGRPLRREYAGGIIAQFRIGWEYAPGEPFEFVVTPEAPRADTGFDWVRWVSRKAEWDTPKGRPALTDRPK